MRNIGLPSANVVFGRLISSAAGLLSFGTLVAIVLALCYGAGYFQVVSFYHLRFFQLQDLVLSAAPIVPYGIIGLIFGAFYSASKNFFVETLRIGRKNAASELSGGVSEADDHQWYVRNQEYFDGALICYFLSWLFPSSFVIGHFITLVLVMYLGNRLLGYLHTVRGLSDKPFVLFNACAYMLLVFHTGQGAAIGDLRSANINPRELTMNERTYLGATLLVSSRGVLLYDATDCQTKFLDVNGRLLDARQIDFSFWASHLINFNPELTPMGLNPEKKRCRDHLS